MGTAPRAKRPGPDLAFGPSAGPLRPDLPAGTRKGCRPGRGSRADTPECFGDVGHLPVGMLCLIWASRFFTESLTDTNCLANSLMFCTASVTDLLKFV